MTFHEHLDSEKFYSQCSHMWFGMTALTKLSVASRGAVHFAIALQNDKSFVADYIKEHLGFDPILDKKEDCFGF